MNKSRPKQMIFRLSEEEYRQLKERISIGLRASNQHKVTTKFIFFPAPLNPFFFTAEFGENSLKRAYIR